jgi:hypothetical protein
MACSVQRIKKLSIICCGQYGTEKKAEKQIRMTKMKKLMTICLVAGLAIGLGLLTCTKPGGLSEPAVNAALEQIQPEAIRAHIRFLADDLLEGRGTGTRGYQLAANYVTAHFEVLGLEPAGTNGTYFQTVPLRKVDMVPTESSLTLVRGDQSQKLTYAEDYVMQDEFLRKDVGAAAPVVFVGFGVTAPELDYDDYAGVDVRGKIVAQLFGAPASFPHSQRAFYSSQALKAENAAAHGAVAILTFLTPERAKMWPWDWIVPQSKMGEMCWLDEEGAPRADCIGVVPQIRGRALLSRAGAEALFTGASQSLDEVFGAAEAGKPPVFDLPVEAKIRTVTRHKRTESPNVAAVLRGSEPLLREEYVVFTAHLDHLGVGEPVEGDSIYNGAVDNASGVAVLLEVARAFASLPQPPWRSILFLAVTGEEKGLLGSEYFAQYPTVPLKSIVANINIDSAVMNRALLDVVAYGAEHSTLGRVVEQAAGQTGVEVSPDPQPEEVIFIRADQFSFVREGVPAVFVIGGFETGDPQLDGAAIMKEWWQTVYHMPKDDFNQPLNFEAGAKLAQVNFLIGYYVATKRQRPTWNPRDFFGEKFGRTREE